jgi:hypothetical protein
MNAPDRSAAVRAFYASHPEHFTTDRHDENRRRSLPALIAELETVNPGDRGRWGVLVKTDRDNKIPCDVIVWRDTGDHFDVMDSQGGMWGAHGPISINGGGAWFWAPASVVDPNGEERALQGPPYDGGEIEEEEQRRTPIDLAPLQSKLDSLTADVAALRADVAALRELVQQVLDRPAPSVPVPEIAFPRYEGSLSLGPLGNQAIVLRPKSDV